MALAFALWPGRFYRASLDGKDSYRSDWALTARWWPTITPLSTNAIASYRWNHAVLVRGRI